MRPSIWNTWLLCFLMTGLSYGQSALRSSTGLSRSTDQTVWTDKAIGFGNSEEQATSNARQVALQQIQERLQQEYPHLKWAPSFKYLNERGALSNNPSFSTKKVGDKSYTEATLNWKVTLRDREDILTQNRARFAESRQTGWGKILAALVLILALGAGYYRLEDATRGYMTRALRAMLIVGIALTLVVLWLWL